MISRMGSPEVQSDAEPETLLRLPLGASATHGGVDEALLQDLLFRFPGTLPIPAVDAAYANAVPVCRELSTPAGFVDALYVNPSILWAGLPSPSSSSGVARRRAVK